MTDFGTRRLAGRRLLAWRTTVLLVVAVPFLGLVAAVAYLWGRGIGPFDLTLFAALYLWTGLGITVGYHRLFTHRGFHAVPLARGALAVAGSMAVQGPIIRWVADHRRHHRFSDRPGDPHSPHIDHDDLSIAGLVRGLWYAHVGWFFDAEKSRARRYAPDLLTDPIVHAVDRLYPLWIAASLLLPAGLTWLLHPSPEGFFTGLLFAGFARIFFVQHVTWSVNSICHTFGARAFDTLDESRNVPIMAILALGEGWHNNHHAFPASARHGLGRWQFDPSWIAICLLRGAGLVSRVRTPTAEQILRRRSRRSRPAGGPAAPGGHAV